ncbi:MAG: DUF262 domain-containing protein [Acidobacteria bacterium]|nr:DUF262 domain-containing protein [Acidobacteriota bacterium]
MRTMTTNYTVQDFLAAMDRGEIKVNRDYQRSDEVWPDTARSYLIETVLLDFPIPKLAIRQITEATGRSYKELVDGQQRSATLRAFRDDQFALSSAVEDPSLRGLKFSTLSRDQRITFLNYQLSVDLFLGAEPAQIREVFRRINSYTVPLNPEEQRHAHFQGKFKWFLHRLGFQFNSGWEAMGVFSQKAMIRMADTKLLAEVSHAILHGISITSKRSLDRLYKDNDEDFEAEAELENRLSGAIKTVRKWEELHGTSLMKPFQMYALLLAIMHTVHPIDLLQPVHNVQRGHELEQNT